MSSFYRCSFFQEPQIKDYESFNVSQEQIVFQRMSDSESSKAIFEKHETNYACSFLKSENFDENLPAVLIPIRDNHELLSYTLANLESCNIHKHSNILVVDDRSKENIKDICLKHQVSYLRVDTESGFNFSMLNNIPAKICSDLGLTTIIMWNSDLWCESEEFFLELLYRHHSHGSKVSGSKLLYPPLSKSMNKEQDSENIKNHFPSLLGGHWRGTVQFGGDYWIHNPGNSFVKYSPIHHKRFTNKDNPLVNCDRGSICLTGALHVWDLEYFISLGGFNPSLPKIFQDNDICLRVIEQGGSVWYFGRDLHFYHDESLTKFTLKDHSKNDKQNFSDNLLFGKIWNEKIERVIL